MGISNFEFRISDDGSAEPARRFDRCSHSTFDIRNSTFAPALSLVELIITLAILSIAASLVVPQLGQTAGTKLVEAARLLAADLGHAQIESITHGQAVRVVVFEADGSGYRLATAADPDTPVVNPIGNVPYVVTFGSGRAKGLGGVTVSHANVGDDDTLGFGVYGQLDQATDATITLACDGATITLTVHASTGEVTIADLD